MSRFTQKRSRCCWRCIWNVFRLVIYVWVAVWRERNRITSGNRNIRWRRRRWFTFFFSFSCVLLAWAWRWQTNSYVVVVVCAVCIVYAPHRCGPQIGWQTAAAAATTRQIIDVILRIENKIGYCFSWFWCGGMAFHGTFRPQIDIRHVFFLLLDFYFCLFFFLLFLYAHNSSIDPMRYSNSGADIDNWIFRAVVLCLPILFDFQFRFSNGFCVSVCCLFDLFVGSEFLFFHLCQSWFFMCFFWFLLLYISIE